MSVTNPMLNLGFSAEQAARLAAADRMGAESVADRLRKTSEDGFKVGSTVTARYRYKVAEDGSFIPLQTQITTDEVGEELRVGSEGRRNRQSLRQNRQERAPTFRDYTAFKPQLSPSDEALIFSSLAGTVPNFGLGAYAPKINVSLDTNIRAAEVEDESGNFVQAEVIAPKTEVATKEERAAFSASFRRAQYSVASLYARSNVAINEPVNEVELAA